MSVAIALPNGAAAGSTPPRTNLIAAKWKRRFRSLGTCSGSQITVGCGVRTARPITSPMKLMGCASADKPDISRDGRSYGTRDVDVQGASLRRESAPAGHHPGCCDTGVSLVSVD